MDDSIKGTLLLVALFTLIVAAVLVFGYVIEYNACKYKSSALELEFTWGPLQGCVVTRRDGVKVLMENYGRSDRD